MSLHQLAVARFAKNKYSTIRRDYKMAIYGVVKEFLTTDKTVDETRKKMELIILAAFLLAYETGIKDGGGENENKTWIKEKIARELVFVAALMVALWSLRQSGLFDADEIADTRSEGYAAGLDGVYNIGKVSGAKDLLLTFLGVDGKPPEFPCPECYHWKGKTRPASFWITNDLIPYPGNTNFTCKGFLCQHGLFDPSGRQFTI